MSGFMRYATLVLLVLAVSVPAMAQTSASYRLTEHAFNAGGRPDDGSVPMSPNLKISLDAIGDAALGQTLSSANYRMDGGFAGRYPPPGETRGLLFTTKDILQWDPERSVGVYNLYRDDLSALSGLGYGACEQYGITGQTANDTDEPSAGNGYFYLVTAENRLGEEGTKGYDSDNAKRGNPAPCP
jgi:hypothetical protein